MKHTKKLKLSSLYYVVAVVVLFIAAVCIKNFQKTNAASVLPSGLVEVPDNDTSLPLGAEHHPFVVLEVVPYEGFASFGYLVKGEEPVDLEICSWSDYAVNTVLKNKHAGIDVVSEAAIQTFDPSPELLAAKQDPYSGIVEEAKAQFGYYKKLAVATGAYNLSLTYESDGVTIATGSFISVASGGAYQWVGFGPEVTSIPAGETTDLAAEKVYTSKMSTLYTAKHFTIINNELFKKECLGLTDPNKIENYKVKVITVTANQLKNSLEDNLELINRANLIYITDRITDKNFAKLWENDTYRSINRFKEDEFLNYSNLNDYDQVRFTASGRDMDWKTAELIFKKQVGYGLAAGVKNCPVVYESNCLDMTGVTWKQTRIVKSTKDGSNVDYGNKRGYQNNAYKLGLMLRQMNSYQLYQMYFAPSPSIINNGEFKTLINWNQPCSDARTYWSQYTLYPYQLIANNNNYESKLRNLGYRCEDFGTNTEYASDNTYIYKSTDSMCMKFTTQVTDYQTYSKDAFIHFSLNSGKLSPAQVIKYLIDCSDDGEQQKEISILEVQPGSIFTISEENQLFKSTEYWTDFIHAKLPAFTGTVKVERQTVKEFNCRVEQFEGSYDLIYIGMNAKSISGLVYRHIGDTIQVNQGDMDVWIPGQNQTVFTTRLSGNDITDKKKGQLEAYSKAGYPIMLGDGIMNGTSIDTTKIDTASYLYNLIKKLTTDTAYNTVYENKTDGHKLSLSFDSNLCYITCLTPPIAYKDPTTTAANVYINGVTSTYKNLCFENLTINEAEGVNGKYRVFLCLDMNADGRYDSSLENVTVSKIKDNNGNYYTSDEYLEAGTPYTINIDIKSYVGVITWQLSVVQYNNSDNETGVKDTLTGISAIKCNSATEKVNLKILQIVKDDNTIPAEQRTTIFLPTQDDITAAKTTLPNLETNTSRDSVRDAFKGKISNNGFTNIPDQKEQLTGLFYYYTRALAGYNLSFKRLTIQQLATAVNADANYLKSYNMLIIGFSDYDWNISDAKTLQAIDEHIAHGKTVLFTHDTSYYAKSNSFSFRFRNVFGMDRYGVMMMTGSDKKVSERNVLKDLPYKPNTLQENNDIDDTYAHGFTDQVARRYSTESSKAASHNDMCTTTVNQINNGQITNYPYLINDNISVAETHFQYLQLDLEDKDIVVWYSLNDKGTNKLELNDGRNTYYIYNKGNITYSGAGHSCASNPDNMEAEVKLFINTIIAAHRASPDESLVAIENADKTGYNGNDFVYVQYDATSVTSSAIAIGEDVTTASQTKRIYFTLKGSGFAQNAKHKVTYSVTNEAGTKIQLNNFASGVPTTPVKTYKKSDNLEESSLTLLGNTTYYMDVPLSFLEKKNKMYLDFDIVLTYGVAGEYQMTSSKQITIIRRGLFNLD